MDKFLGQVITTSRINVIDARIKIVTGVILLAMVLSYQGFAFQFYVLGAFCCSCFVLHIPLRRIIVRFAEPLFIVTVLILIQGIFTGSDKLFSIALFRNTISCHSDGLLAGCHIATRVLAAVSVITFLGFTTAFTDMLTALSWFRVPKEFVEISMLAYRYIFVMFEDAFIIYNAQRNRLGYSTIRRGMNSFGVLTGTLILKAFDQSQVTTVAMMQRGYNGAFPQQIVTPLKWKDVSSAFLVVVVSGVLWKL